MLCLPSNLKQTFRIAAENYDASLNCKLYSNHEYVAQKHERNNTYKIITIDERHR
jgi:hypothetical protein